jgi:apolipoprotein D and lipocalin family protein
MATTVTTTEACTDMPSTMNRRQLLAGLAGLPLASLTACSTAPPAGVQVVSPFDANRYMGLWYEIARLDHRFERGMSRVSAHYRLNDDGSVAVTNRGFLAETQTWREAQGVAKFTGERNVGSLKVSFFGPFYGGYYVVALDQLTYNWSMVLGPDTDYLWILCRQRQLPADVRAQLVQQAKQLGVNTDALIWVDQSA